MGYWKNRQIEEFDRGFKYTGEKFVCYDCIGNDYIKDYIKENATQTFCSYCKRNENKNISIHLDELLEIIMDGVKSEYDDPKNCMGWVSSEGGWLGAKTYDNFDILDIYEAELEIENNKLIEDIRESIISDEWCEENPYGPREYEEHISDWNKFCEIIKHKMRFTFLVKHLSREESFETINENLVIKKNIKIQVNNIIKVLFYITENLNEIGIVREIEEGSIFYRGRTHDFYQGYKKAIDLGTAPVEAAINSNRMSPAGIPMFYGSLDTDTVYEEMRKDNNPYISIGKFIALVPLHIIDFSELPPMPTVFNPETRYLRQPIMFFNEFAEDISKSVSKDRKEHIEYVPTQVITEYFRYIFKYYDNKIDGIFYKSACENGGVCCVLFMENQDCTDNKIEKDKKLFLSEAFVQKY